MQIISLILAASTAGFAAAGPLVSTNPNAASVVEKRAAFPIPASKGTVKYTKTYTIAKGKTFDGGLKTYGRGVSCTGQAEGGNADAVFILEDGATLANAIIGKDQIEGVHCLGSCTIKNVWWSAVCEDALTLKGNGNVNISGGGATGASDKVIQHNAAGTVTINGFNVQNFGKLYRSCGNCKGNGAAKKVVMTNVKAVSGKALAGINSNYGDTATIGSTNCATSVKQICNEYTGNNNGKEPPLKHSGVSTACKISTLKAC